MSVAARLVSGSTASWARILITVISQVALVPVYLKYWTVETYGVWLAIQALVYVMTMPDLGHQTYLAYEFLRQRQDLKSLRQNFWSAVGISGCMGFMQVVIIIVFIYIGLIPKLLGKADLTDITLLQNAGQVLLIQGLTWFIASTIPGLFVRVLEPFGYLPRLAWWGVLSAVVINASPAIAVALGADFLTAAYVLAAGSILIDIPVCLDMWYLLKKEKITFHKPVWQLGYRNFLKSTGVMGKLLLENARQQGVRLVLAPLSGAVGLAAFSTMRTGSNVALQGLNTITNPLMPDLMRFLHDRDQLRSEAAFGTVWIVVIAIMAPATILFQIVSAPLFDLWTRGNIVFDPALFALLSMTVLIYAVAQPAMAVVTGNNLLRPQLILSIVAAVVVIGGIIVLVPPMGMIGAGIALVAAELVASVGYIIAARKWLNSKSLVWPASACLTAAGSVAIAGIAMTGIVLFPEYELAICGVAMILCGWNLIRYWRILPSFVTQRVSGYVKNLPGIRKIFPVRQL